MQDENIDAGALFLLLTEIKKPGQTFFCRQRVRSACIANHPWEGQMFIRRLALGSSFTLFAVVAAAQERPPYGPDVSVETAKTIAAGALAESKKNGWRMAIAIVDNHGFLVYFERMEDTQTAGVEVSIDKARAAAMFRRPTKVFEDGVNKGRPALLGLRGATPLEGGVPIMAGGKVIGAIGVSGANADQDAQAATAGIKAAGL